jgi:hypothetical protein
MIYNIFTLCWSLNNISSFVTDKSENKQVKAGQKTMDNFMKTSNRPSAIQRTPPTPTEKLHDQQGSSKGRKKLKPSTSSTPSCTLMFGSGKTRS